MTSRKVRDFSKRGDAIPVPELTMVQLESYQRFIQSDRPHDQRDPDRGGTGDRERIAGEPGQKTSPSGEIGEIAARQPAGVARGPVARFLVPGGAGWGL